VGLIGAVVVIGFGAYWVEYLRMAHSSFDNYYKFRGCSQLIEKTDLYAVCKLPNGDTIKLVHVKDKWFLDGDLGW
jgi:hypothetical protein